MEAEAARIDEQRLKKQQEYIDQTFEKELAKLPEELREPIRIARSTLPAKQTPEQKKLLKEQPSVNVTAGSLYLYDRQAADDLKDYAARAAAVRQMKPVEEFVQALTEVPGQVPTTYLFHYFRISSLVGGSCSGTTSFCRLAGRVRAHAIGRQTRIAARWRPWAIEHHSHPTRNTMFVEVQITINGPKAAVWAAITNIENASEIISGIMKIEVLEKPASGLVGLYLARRGGREHGGENHQAAVAP